MLYPDRLLPSFGVLYHMMRGGNPDKASVVVIQAQESRPMSTGGLDLDDVRRHPFHNLIPVHGPMFARRTILVKRVKRSMDENPKITVDRFTKALASVLSVSPDEIRDKLAQAKTEKPSPHKRYKYVPEEDRA